MHAALLALVLAQTPLQLTPPPPRFELEKPLTTIPGVMADEYEDGMGLAQQMARAHHLQARIMWVDGTANLERVNSEDKIKALMAKLKEVGFNTVVFDIKPISGQVLYKSKIAPKITEWRGQTLPEDFDPLPIMIREAHANGLQLFVSMNAFSEGHTLFKTGPGYETPEHQSVLYVANPVLSAEDGSTIPLSSTANSAPTDDQAHIWTTPGKLSASPDTYYAAMRADGYVLQGAQGSIPEKPKGGYILAGSNKAGEFLKEQAKFGDVLKLTTQTKYLRTSQHPDQYPLMMNPNDPDVQQRNLDIIHEVVSNYKLDGVLYDDRLRFAGMDADFSNKSRAAFEKWLGKQLSWPDDVFKFTANGWVNTKIGIQPGPYYEAWMVWRALQIRHYVARVRHEIKSTRPGCLFGIYGGSWYGEYPKFGTNYGAPGLNAGFWFLTPKYAKTGFANLLDLLITGCYYTTPTIYDAMSQGQSPGSTVEAAGQLSNRVADDQCWTYAGISLESFNNNPDGLQKALQAACVSTQGVMVFDLSHNIEASWPAFAQAFQVKAVSPSARPQELANVRRLRARYRELGARERPIVIQSGSSGTGF